MFQPTAAERSASLLLVIIGIALFFAAYKLSKSKKEAINGLAIVPALLGFGCLVLGGAKLF